MSFLFPSPPSPPSMPAPPPPPPLPPKALDPSISRARAKSRQRAALAGSRESTILTSGMGLTTPAFDTAKKKLLGA